MPEKTEIGYINLDEKNGRTHYVVSKCLGAGRYGRMHGHLKNFFDGMTVRCEVTVMEEGIYKGESSVKKYKIKLEEIEDD